MKYNCKLCNGRGKQKNSLTCTCCRGLGFFNVTGKIEECNSCKGSGRGVIKTLSCIKCGGKGFSVLSKATDVTSFKAAEIKAPKIKAPRKEEPKIPKMPVVPKVSVTKKSSKKRTIAGSKKKTINKGEFGEAHLDSLQEKLTEILESPQ